MFLIILAIILKKKKLKFVNIRMCNGKWSLVVFDFLRKLILKTSWVGLSWFHMVVFIEKFTVARLVG